MSHPQVEVRWSGLLLEKGLLCITIIIVMYCVSSFSCTPKQWVEHVVTVTDGSLQNSWSTFELFLHILPQVIGIHSNSGSLWKQFKGRVYSKIHRRWLAELSGCGLVRLCSLYLTLTKVTEQREVVSWSHDTHMTLRYVQADKMISTLLSLSKERLLVWKGVCAFSLVVAVT